MKFDERAAMSFLGDSAQTMLATVFLTGWIICCAATALLLRIEKSIAADLPSAKESTGNKSLNGGGFVRRCCKKQLLKSRNFLTKVPEALGI